jgi:hypothetical protein
VAENKIEERVPGVCILADSKWKTNKVKNEDNDARKVTRF